VASSIHKDPGLISGMLMQGEFKVMLSGTPFIIVGDNSWVPFRHTISWLRIMFSMTV